MIRLAFLVLVHGACRSIQVMALAVHGALTVVAEDIEKRCGADLVMREAARVVEKEKREKAAEKARRAN